MSAKTVETILSRAISEAAFAERLFADPGGALAGYDLTAEEISQLKEMSHAKFTAQQTEDRKSFGLSLNHNETALRCE